MDYDDAQETFQEIQGEEEVVGTRTHKFLWFSFFGVLFVVIIVSLFFILNPPGSNNVTDKELMEGATVNTGENNSIKFKFGDEDHNINIDFVGLDSVGITIQSDPITFILQINEVKEVDLNKDDIYDLRVKLVKIENGKATIAVKKIAIEVCNENWNCSAWSTCSNGKQFRVCEDLNNCEIVKNRPYTQKSCIEVEFVENDSYFEENNSVNNSANNTNNSNIELGESSLKINCSEDINSFISASETCSPFRTICNSSLNVFGVGVFENVTTNYEIKGLESENCIFYFEYANITIYYSSEFEKAALNEGVTKEQIDAQLEETNQEYKKLIGKNSTCHYPIADLTAMISGWKAGNISGSSDDYKKYNCIGSLYEGMDNSIAIVA